MKRRRFLTLSAAFASAPSLSRAAPCRGTWTGQAMGADVSVTLKGPRQLVQRTLTTIPAHLDDMESAFSLYRSDSALSRLNRNGFLRSPADLRGILDDIDAAYALTDGLFDPTVQPLWRALADGRDTAEARKLIGWRGVINNQTDGIRLRVGQKLTLNGIAQGFATDFVRGRLKAAGFDHALIDIGEQAALGGPFTLGLSDPEQGIVSTLALSDRAVASSSPAALRLGDQWHILAPDGRPPLWSTVSIEAASATLADALSTAAVFMDLDRLRRLKREAGLFRITAVDAEGNLRTV